MKIPQERTIQISTHNQDTQLCFQEIHLEDSTYRCQLRVKSGWIECNRLFFFDRTIAERFLETLKEMNQSFNGVGVLKSEWEDPFIHVACSKLGQIIISGLLIEHSDLPQRVEFTFETDQTILNDLIHSFNALLNPM